MKTTVRFDGGAELAKALSELSLRVQKGVMLSALKEGAEPMRDAMQRTAPRGDPAAPNLADSMVVGSARQKGVAASVAVGPTKDVPYGVFLEHGTVHMDPKPFMRPSFDSERGRSLAIIGASLWRAMIKRGVVSSSDVSEFYTGGELL